MTRQYVEHEFVYFHDVVNDWYRIKFGDNIVGKPFIYADICETVCNFLNENMLDRMEEMSQKFATVLKSNDNLLIRKDNEIRKLKADMALQSYSLQKEIEELENKKVKVSNSALWVDKEECGYEQYVNKYVRTYGDL